jgi:hypothetical protein
LLKGDSAREVVSEIKPAGQRHFCRPAGSNRGSVIDQENAVDRADGDACGLVVRADAVSAGRFIDDVNRVAGRDGVDRAFGFARSAVGAFISDAMCHDYRI